MLPFAQRVGRRLVIFVIAASAVAASTAIAGGAAHTSDAPQPLPFKPYNLYSLLNQDDLIAEIERRFQPIDWPAHLERVTRGLVAAPYLLSPLGEGGGIDQDPRFRLDAFDCTTFVETALALAHCDDYDQLQVLLDDIRYVDGEPTFQTRRHLITSQWIPDLTKAGLIRDITTDIGEEETRFIHLELTRRRWKRRRVARTLPLRAEQIPYGRYHLPYLPIELARRQIARIPPGTIINVVRADRRRSPDVVTHQGLVIVRPGGRHRLVRHASPVSKRVIDESLDHMLRRYLKPRKWPIVGINLLKILPPRRGRSVHATSASGPG